MDDDKGTFEHRRVSAASTTRPVNNAFTSVFGMGDAVKDTTKVVKARGGYKKKSADLRTPAKATTSTPANPQIREGTMRHRCLQTVEACGSLTTDGIAEAMGITLKQASDLANQLATLKFLTKGEADGRKTYTVTKREGGFYGWLEKKAQAAGQSTLPTKPAKAAKGKPVVATVAAPAPAAPAPAGPQPRFALFNTGALCIEVKSGKVELDQEETKTLLDYLDRITGAASPGG